MFNMKELLTLARTAIECALNNKEIKVDEKSLYLQGF